MARKPTAIYAIASRVIPASSLMSRIGRLFVVVTTVFGSTQRWPTWV
jgi:hypothetical protein